MRIIKFSLIFVSLSIYLVLGIILKILLFKANKTFHLNVINRMTVCLMHVFTALGGIKVTVLGKKEILKEKGLFIISTHIGYLDGIILGSIVPGSFTTKSGIKKVPLLGRVVAIGGSIFVDRSKKNHIVRYIKVMCERLNTGINVFNFPEGHATNGTKILPFFKTFFNAPLKTKAPIVPITIDYKKINGSTKFDRDLVYCYDDKISIIKHLWSLMDLKSIEVDVTVHEKVQVNGYLADSKGRREISDLCTNRLAKYKNLPLANRHPLVNSSASN